MVFRSRPIALLALSLIGSFTSASSSYANYFSGVTVGQIQIDNRPCVFFWVNGVNQPEPSISNDHWFALPKSAANYQEMVSELFSAKLTGKPLIVSTDGSASCGYATVNIIGLDQ